MDEGRGGVGEMRMAHLPPVDVSEIVSFLYRSCADLSPGFETAFGLELRERINDLKDSDFGTANIDKIEKLTSLLDVYASTQDSNLQKSAKECINSIALKLLRLAKKLP